MINIEVIAPTMEIQTPSDTVVHTELKILAEPNVAMLVSSRLCGPAGYDQQDTDTVVITANTVKPIDAVHFGAVLKKKKLGV
ncbi:unnamed protein product [Macrosiphum euphorbiae]|uniref:Uncharacterized protein n=1 Tax=Macrosiphum euphorbiae TaxID=13131 RepID=A0AAV0XDX9_9HEMI|nr:unnamed protein product [Macrosiphum euphorbiae]